jgi:hypothetical protein
LSVYVNDPTGYFTANDLARIQDAINGLDLLLAPYNINITEVSDPTQANLVIDDGPTSAAGAASDGVLGCYNGAAGEVTILQGWNWYDGADPTQIGAGQYDFQTVVTQELGHALGLGGSTDPNSVMNESLAAGVVRRAMTVADLNIPDPPEGADPERATPGQPGMRTGATVFIVTLPTAGSETGAQSATSSGLRLNLAAISVPALNSFAAVANGPASPYTPFSAGSGEQEIPAGTDWQEPRDHGGRETTRPMLLRAMDLLWASPPHAVPGW